MDIFFLGKINPRTEEAQILRSQSMDEANPVFVLRNHLLQWAIELAENGDFSGLPHLSALPMSCTFTTSFHLVLFLYKLSFLPTFGCRRNGAAASQ